MATNRTLSALALLALLPAGMAFAQQPKIGFVDIPSIIDRAPSAKAASARLDMSGHGTTVPWRSITPLQSNHMGLLKDPKLLAIVLDLLGQSGRGAEC